MAKDVHERVHKRISGIVEILYELRLLVHLAEQRPWPQSPSPIIAEERFAFYGSRLTDRQQNHFNNLIFEHGKLYTKALRIGHAGPISILPLENQDEIAKWLGTYIQEPRSYSSLILIARAQELREVEQQTNFSTVIEHSGDQSMEQKFAEMTQKLNFVISRLSFHEMRIKSTKYVLCQIKDNLDVSYPEQPTTPKGKEPMNTSSNAPPLEPSTKLLRARLEALNPYHEALLLEISCNANIAQSQLQIVYSLIAQRDSRESLQMAELSTQIANLTKKDSFAMFTLAVMSVLFLPGAWVATLFSMSMFNWQAQDGAAVLTPRFWIYWAVTVPLTLVVLCSWLVWLRYHHKNEGTPLRALREVPMEIGEIQAEQTTGSARLRDKIRQIRSRDFGRPQGQMAAEASAFEPYDAADEHSRDRATEMNGQSSGFERTRYMASSFCALERKSNGRITSILDGFTFSLLFYNPQPHLIVRRTMTTYATYEKFGCGHVRETCHRTSTGARTVIRETIPVASDCVYCLCEKTLELMADKKDKAAAACPVPPSYLRDLQRQVDLMIRMNRYTPKYHAALGKIEKRIRNPSDRSKFRSGVKGLAALVAAGPSNLS
ncbi:hypothetical protein F4778DRAFT_775446 [Xylariomycetidae sp. FL2044]|nr:hypothetical protein F4778DRAFT_775446 [Xylariomycetidae sp. FL2044]